MWTAGVVPEMSSFYFHGPSTSFQALDRALEECKKPRVWVKYVQNVSK